GSRGPGGQRGGVARGDRSREGVTKGRNTMRKLPASLQAAIAACGVVLVSTSAAAQGDIVGVWQQPGNGLLRGGQYEDQLERCCGGGAGMGGPAAADYLGIPLNEAGRARALAHDDSLWEVPEHQCQPHVATYAYWG